ncbi:MAG: tetratricopeptide repeat protein [Sulfuricurvum sp.]|jgi:hypothetical protein
MTKKLKIVLIAFVLMGSFSYSNAGWFSFGSTYDRALEAYGKNKNIEALGLYEQSCDEGNFESCSQAGHMYQYGYGAKQSHTKASEFYAKACRGGYSGGCNNLQSMEKSETNFKNFKQAQENCIAGSADWCGKLGIHYYQGEGVDKNLDLAEKYLQQSCDREMSNSCAWLGRLSYDRKDYFKAFESLYKACNAGVAAACVDVGNLYKDGHGTRLDLTKAADFYGKACDMKIQQGCEKYSQLKSPQPVQQIVNNTSNSNYQQEQLNIQRQQLKLQQEQNLQNQLNSTAQQNQLMNMQNAQYLHNLRLR